LIEKSLEEQIAPELWRPLDETMAQRKRPRAGGTPLHVAAFNDNANARANGANANATSGAAGRGNEEDHGANFIGAGKVRVDNHP
jgi:hypothetical protein